MRFWDFLFGKNNNSEIATEITPNSPNLINLYTENGISIRVNENSFTIYYNGILAQKGALNINLLTGYGDINNWTNVTSYTMKNNGDKTFEVDIPRLTNTRLNLVFNDGIDNWDNNQGQNYSFLC
ncbi:MAG: carbohydrate-binding protein [Clostridiales bacterium]|nr:carbohydrate-binding protein [Clostridiales bacterium]